MDEPPTAPETVLKTQRRAECMELRLVLNAAGIPAEAQHRDGWWTLVVHPNNLARSTAELDAYRRENPISPKRPGVSFPQYGGAGIAVSVYVLVMVVVATWDAVSAFNVDWQSIGAMEAGKVRDGQWWRCFTALTLHVDAGHLIANLVFGTVFGLIAGRIVGGGVGWLVMIVAGALGNFANALLRSPIHSSIGASTAVFAALGMIVFHAIRGGGSDQVSPMKRWSPLIGGLVLFAYTGVGSERTDVVAHATGFLSGMLVGWIGSHLPPDWLASKKVQTIAGLGGIALITAAWIIGLVTAG